jgi:hypothetical protein
MQFFAEPDNNSSNGSDDNKNQDNPQNQDNSGQQQNNANDNQNQDQTQQNPEPKFDFMKELGMSEDDIKKLISNKQAEDEKNKTAETKLAEATAKAAKAEAKVAAMQLGVKPTAVDDVIAIASVRDPEGKNFKTTIADILKQYPTFSVADIEAKKGTGSNLSGKKSLGNKEESLGKRLAQNATVKTKSSFFNN